MAASVIEMITLASLYCAHARDMTVDPGTGEELDAIVEETLRLPREVVEKVGKMME